MAKSDTDEFSNNPDIIESTLGMFLDNSILDKSNSRTIHSGHFMISCIHEDDQISNQCIDDVNSNNDLSEETHSDDDINFSPSIRDQQHQFQIANQKKRKPSYNFETANKSTFPSYQFGKRCSNHTAIDASLTKLFDCMTLAYSDNKLTSPKWKNFKGTKLPLKDKIRLNNIIWREWHMQYIQGLAAQVCQFDPPISDKTHCKPEAVVLEGKYWKRKLDVVTTEYKKWRTYHKKIFAGKAARSSNRKDHCFDSSPNSRSSSLFPDKTSPSYPSDPFYRVDLPYDQTSSDYANDFLPNTDDSYVMDFSDTLFTTFINQPFTFPNPKEMLQLGNADIIQPGLVQLQPNIDDIMMGNLSPLPPLPEMRQSYKSDSPISLFNQSPSSSLLDQSHSPSLLDQSPILDLSPGGVLVDSPSSASSISGPCDRLHRPIVSPDAAAVLNLGQSATPIYTAEAAPAPPMPGMNHARLGPDSGIHARHVGPHPLAMIHSNSQLQTLLQSFPQNRPLQAKPEANFMIPEPRRASTGSQFLLAPHQKPAKPKQRLIAPAIKKSNQSSDSYLGQLLRQSSNPYQHVIRPNSNIISLPKGVNRFQQNMLIAATSQAIGIPAQTINAVTNFNEEPRSRHSSNDSQIELTGCSGVQIKTENSRLLCNNNNITSSAPSMTGMSVSSLMMVNNNGKKISHITAEQKRRCNIKSGFDTLHSLVPSLQITTSGKTSKALTLQKAIDYCKRLKCERKAVLDEISELRKQVECLNHDISVCQATLPATGVPITRQRADEMKSLLDSYIKTRTLQNWKFWIFSIIIRPLFHTFNSMVSTANADELCRSTLTWLEQYCSLVALRPAVLNSLTHLSTTTSILSDPSLVPDQAHEAVRDLNN